ncbi:hypothetical protein [Caballeronia sp. SBC1]|uniref:hypothetical protein n=1 Tax=Caballeronia sp. SBC1 TaxID=2705548 RepID=UPI00140A4B6D|nr:hypothetical protein [Caballeronia sp. SBC1]
MIESATVFVCIGGNDPLRRFNRCQLASRIEIADRFGDLGETFNRCTYNHFTPCMAA